MSTTDQSKEASSADSVSGDETSSARVVTNEERDALIEDAKDFKETHDRTFRILSDG